MKHVTHTLSNNPLRGFAYVVLPLSVAFWAPLLYLVLR